MKLLIDGEWKTYLPYTNHEFLADNSAIDFSDIYEKVWETDCGPIYKKDKDGVWQEMVIHLKIIDGKAYIKSIIRRAGKKPRIYTSPIKEVGSKAYSRVIEERLVAKATFKVERDGWVRDKDTKVLYEPMLLHQYDKYKHKLTWPVLLSPKLNGIRATYQQNSETMYSRKRMPFHHERITEQLKLLGMSCDGELWNQEMSLEEIVSAVAHKDERLEYWIMDRPQGGPYVQRMATLIKKFQKIGNSLLPNIKIVPQALANNEQEVEDYYKVLMEKEKGIDGIVIREINYVYQWNTRSYKILKKKPFIMREYEVCEVRHDDDAEHGKLITLRFKTKDHKRFWYTPAWSKEERAIASRDQVDPFNPTDYVGRVYTLTFREYTKYGLPKHIMDLTERNYE